MNRPPLKSVSRATEDLLDLHQHEQSPEFQQALERDFGGALAETGDGFSRRRWLQLMGASLALGGAAGCRYQEEQIASFAFRPQNMVPGIPQHYATFTELGGVAEPLLATSYDGRPIKLDGNPQHPESQGAAHVYSLARILEFYDPDRLRAPLRSTAGGFVESEFAELVEACQFPADCSAVAILAEPQSSPSLMRLRKEFEAHGGRWFSFAPINDDQARAGAKLAFGKSLRAHYDLNTKVILTLDADPLYHAPGNIANAIAFGKSRDADHGHMSRLYCVESQFTTTGAAADHRLSVRSRDIGGFLASLAAALENPTAPDASQPYRQRVLAALVSDLKANPGESVILVGETQPPEVHALAFHLNQQLGNLGKTVTFSEPADIDRPSSLASIASLAEGLQDGSINHVVVLGGNPVYQAPPELKLGELLQAAKTSLHISTTRNETGEYCQWISAVAHPLESWKDGVTQGGSTLVGQPLINPLFGGKSDLETLAILLGMPETSGQEIVKATLGLGAKEWTQAVHDGFVAGSQATLVEVTSNSPPAVEAHNRWAEPWDGSTMEVVFKPDPSVYDGRFANNAWLQELPDLFTKVTWDNVAQVSPATAEKLGVTQRGMGGKSTASLMTITLNGVPQKVPVAIQPGQADGSIGLSIGYGRTMAGRVGGNVSAGVDPVGHNVIPLRSAQQWLVASLDASAVSSTGSMYTLAIVQEPWAIDEVARNEIQARMFRNYDKTESDRSALIREGTLESYKEFLEKHPVGENHAQARKVRQQQEARRAGQPGALPVLNQVSYHPDDESKQEGDDHDHGHGHAQWPEAFHMHHSLFDLTPGVREEYKAENPEHTNVWGMSIDLNKCIGCNACVIACQSENNIPVVGKAEVWRGREMHWIRIDRYYGDNLYTTDAREDDPVMVQQPVTCHHCENAPCETVCPVAATVHSSEGLNDMVYNRCIGTRYCGNNCPYKVRRFNYLNYSDAVTLLKYPGADKLKPADLQLQNLMMNPEVTIRSRGVMEKCTYCVQRIQNTKIQAKNEHRKIGPNEIATACQTACPTSAIRFGDLNNLDSDVRQAQDNPRSYYMLEDLNNRPRTKYLARVRNPHPVLIDQDDRDSVGGHGGHAGESHDTHAEPAQPETEAAH